jgi:hypothetical protein
MKMFFTCRGWQIEKSVCAFAMRVAELFIANIGDGKMGEINRIS